MKKILQITIMSILFISCLAIAVPAIAGEGNHEEHGENNNNNNGDTRVPINGGLSMLLVAGIAFGVKKLYDSKNSSKKATSIL